MRPYSEDLRRKLLAACDDGACTRREVADLFHVSVAFVHTVLRRWRKTGQVAARPHAGGRPAALSEAGLAQVRAWLVAQPDLTLREVCARLQRQQGLEVSVPTMCRAVQRLELPREKQALHASERDTPRVQALRRAWWRRVQTLDVRRLLVVDEPGITTAMTRRYGRAPRGQRVVGAVPDTYGQTVTVLGALGARGLRALMSVDGPTNAAVFLAFLEQVLRPRVRTGDIVVMDRLGAHRVQAVRATIRAAGARLLYLPRGWFRHCGYALH